MIDSLLYDAEEHRIPDLESIPLGSELRDLNVKKLTLVFFSPSSFW